ncbi:preprotein translocase subunit YajC [Pseudonocardia sp. DLS-67]
MELLFPLLILLLFIPIFLSGRKQRRQQQEMQKMQAALEAGDVVMTTSGLRGTIVDASYEDTLDIEIADGVITTWVRGAVREKVDPVISEDDAPAEETPAAPAAVTEPEPDEAAAPSLEKSAVEKDESTNGTARS